MTENGEDDDDEKDEEWCEEEVSSVQCSLSLPFLSTMTVGEEMTSDYHLLQIGPHYQRSLSLLFFGHLEAQYQGMWALSLHWYVIWAFYNW